MKNYLKWLLGFFGLMFVLAGATLVYTRLSLDYEKQRQGKAAEKQQDNVVDEAVDSAFGEMADSAGSASQAGVASVQAAEAQDKADDGRVDAQDKAADGQVDAQDTAVDDQVGVRPDAADELAVFQGIDFTMLNVEGEKVALSELSGKPMLLNFWATWCGPCQMEMPHIEEAYQEYGDEVQFVLVNLTDGRRDTVEGVTQFIADTGYSFPVYFDTEMKGAYAYGAYSIPLTYFLDETGEVISNRLGAMTKEDLYEQLQVLLAGDR